MTKAFFTLAILFLLSLQIFGQHLGLTFEEAEKQGILIKDLDSIYKNELHSDTSQTVFKTEKEQETMYHDYNNLLQGWGNFLSENDFKWEIPTRCFTRIYFNSDGTIDYFLFNFLGDKPSEEKQQEFQRLLNLFIQDYKISLTASTKFAQCTATTYMPKQ